MDDDPVAWLQRFTFGCPQRSIDVLARARSAWSQAHPPIVPRSAIWILTAASIVFILDVGQQVILSPTVHPTAGVAMPMNLYATEIRPGLRYHVLITPPPRSFDPAQVIMKRDRMLESML